MVHENLLAQKIFEGIPETTIEQLCNLGRSVSLKAGDILIEEGEEVRNIYCILEGEVDVLVHDAFQDDNNATWVNVLTDGECVGEYSFLDHRPASATVKAIKDVELLEISHDNIRTILNDDDALRAQFYENLLKNMVERLRNTNVYVDYLRRNKTTH